jgi:hypothetical protein
VLVMLKCLRCVSELPTSAFSHSFIRHHVLHAPASDTSCHAHKAIHQGVRVASGQNEWS